MTIDKITFQVAWELSSDRQLLKTFYQHAEAGQWIYFTHTPFFYSYPIFGKIWPDGKSCQFHQVKTRCHICGQTPDRNYAGYGTLILQCTGPGARMNLVCDDHISGNQFNPGLFVGKAVEVVLNFFI